MGALGGRQPQRAGDRLEHVERGAHVASLLEPRVPGGADAGELRDLLAAQAGRAPPSAARQADVLGLDALAALAQEIGQLLAPAGAVAVRLTLEGSAVVIRLSSCGCHIYYQDKPLSCTWISMIAH